MRIAIFHGYELTGSGSNEYTRYLAAALAAAGHTVFVVCREPHPESVAELSAAIAWDADGIATAIFGTPGQPGEVTLHQLPHAGVRPVYVTDKQREGNVKAFTELTDAELFEVQTVASRALAAALRAHPVDVVHANHLVLQPTIAADACGALDIPFVIYPHGSDIEYTIRRDPRYLVVAGTAIPAAAGIISGSSEMIERLNALYPQLHEYFADRTQIVGVGVDVTLFAPVAPRDRRASIENFAATRPGGGKSVEQREELTDRLDRGEIAAVSDYHNTYAHDLPDEDVVEQLRRVPWESGHVMLFVGALTAGKGLQSLIAAMPAIVGAVPDAHLVIVGAGTYRETLEALVHALADGDGVLLDALIAHGNDFEAGHLSGEWADVAAYAADPVQRSAMLHAGPEFAEHIHFTGRLDHSRLKLVFPCADLAVFPSLLPEAYPLVLMESLSSGVLPAASDTTGLREGLNLLEPHLGVEVVERLRLPMDPAVRVAGIAERLTSLLMRPTSHDAHEELRAIAVAEYDWPVRATAMVAAYQRAIAQTL